MEGILGSRDRLQDVVYNSPFITKNCFCVLLESYINSLASDTIPCFQKGVIKLHVEREAGVRTMLFGFPKKHLYQTR